MLELERDELTGAVRGADAVVFAAGAGAGSGPERKQTVDLGGAVKLIDACRAEGVARYLMISATGAADPSAGPEAMRPYLEAKAEADRRLAGSGLDFTIVRPGRLTDEPGTGRIDAAPSLGRRGEERKGDVAQTLLEVLEAPNAVGKTFEVLGGRSRSPRRSPRPERVTASAKRESRTDSAAVRTPALPPPEPDEAQGQADDHGREADAEARHEQESSPVMPRPRHLRHHPGEEENHDHPGHDLECVVVALLVQGCAPRFEMAYPVG